MRAEPVAPDERHILATERLVHVYHIHFQDEERKQVCFRWTEPCVLCPVPCALGRCAFRG